MVGGVWASLSHSQNRLKCCPMQSFSAYTIFMFFPFFFEAAAMLATK
jgi:hypothetical protein